MRDLAKIIAKVKGGSYDGAMIIKAVWKREPGAGLEEPVILKENRKLLVCKAHYQDASLTVTMLLGHQVPTGEQLMADRGIETNTDSVAWQRFSRQQVVDFVQEVGDSNPIHQTANPVVPGMLLMDAIKASLPDAMQELSLSFRNAVFSTDVLQLELDAAEAEEAVLLQAGERAVGQQGNVRLWGRQEYITGFYR